MAASTNADTPKITIYGCRTSPLSTSGTTSTTTNPSA